MKTRIITEKTYIDKSNWPDGSWKNEPDEISWIDNETGYHCYIKRVSGDIKNQTGWVSGHLCGYVGVDELEEIREELRTYPLWLYDIQDDLIFSKKEKLKLKDKKSRIIEKKLRYR